MGEDRGPTHGVKPGRARTRAVARGRADRRPDASGKRGAREPRARTMAAMDRTPPADALDPEA